MAKKVKVGIADFETVGQGFIEAWKRAEQGDPPEKPVEQIYFANMETLLKTLTEKKVLTLGARARRQH